jgi:hypothetical protein
MAKYGMAIPGTQALDNRWNPDTYQGMAGVNPDPDPYGRVGKTLPEAEPGMSNVNAEKQEKVLGNFTADGLPSLMNVDGPPHTEGGKDISVPPNSFIFSDTKSLKIKDPEILKFFNQPKAATPAQIATKYDLQKFTKVLSNPDSDNTEKKTAQMMVDNYTQKLSQLAAVQEGMKEKMGKGDGQVPQMPQQGMPQQSQPIAQDGGSFRFDQNADPSTNSYQQWLMANKPNSVAMATTLAGEPNAGKFDDGNWGARTDMVSGMNENGIRAGTWQKPPNEYLDKLPNYSTDPVPDPLNIQGVPVPGNNLGSLPVAGKTDVPFTSPTPDKWALANSIYNLATIHKYPAWEAPIGATTPDTVFLDPTRALAANSEAANSQSFNAALSGNSRASRASSAAIQGETGRTAADIVGKYNNENVDIANRASATTTDISNRLQAEQAQRLNKLYQGNVIANQEYDNATREGRNDITRQAEQNWKDRQTYDFLNKTSPYFTVDPVTGARGFKSPEAEAAFNNQVLGKTGNYSSGQGERVNAIYQELIKQPAYQTDEGKKQALMLAQEQAGVRERERLNETGFGMPKSQTLTGIYAGPQGQKFGGQVNRKFGGMTNHQLKKFVNGGKVK